MRIQPVERAAQQIVQRGNGRLTLSHAFDERGEIGCRQQPQVVPLDALAVVRHRGLTQRVEIAAAAARPCDFRAVKKIELAGEGTARAARAFRGGADDAVLPRTPVNDETGVREQRLANEDTVRLLHAAHRAAAEPRGKRALAA